MIFIDADAFIGLCVPTDAHYKKSAFLFEKLKKEAADVVTSWDVISEVATKLSRFATKQIALKFLDLIKEIDIRLEFVDQDSAQEIINLFIKQTSKRVSLTDCANMAIAKKLGVRLFLSFDEHYVQNGFRLFGTEG